MIKVGSDFSGVGAFNQALIRLGIAYKTIFACDMDKSTRKTYIVNYGNKDDIERFNNPVLGFTDHKYSFDFPINVYNRSIPKKPLGIYISTPPCQTFSLAGKRKGEDDKRGILFYNTHEFITKNKYENKIEKLDEKYPETRVSMLDSNLENYTEKCYNNFVAALYLRQKRNQLKLQKLLEHQP